MPRLKRFTRLDRIRRVVATAIAVVLVFALAFALVYHIDVNFSFTHQTREALDVRLVQLECEMGCIQ